MSRRRRGSAAVALAVAAALSLAACGSGDSDSGSGSGKSDNGAGGKSVATGGEDFAKAAEKTAKLGTTAKVGEFPRTIKHATGETELKARPKRGVVLDVGELDNVVSLGVQPVGWAPTEGSAGIPSYLKKNAGSPKDIGTILEDVGIPRPKNQQINDLAAEISPERIDAADADWIFTGVYGGTKKTDRATAEDNPLSKKLGAVEDGRAKDVPDVTWYLGLGLGVTAADEVLDDLKGFLAK